MAESSVVGGQEGNEPKGDKMTTETTIETAAASDDWIEQAIESWDNAEDHISGF